MTVNYTTLLGLAQPVTGTEANTWGDVVNDEITALIEEAVAGGETIDVTSGNVTLSTTQGAANQARNAILLVTGTPGTSRNIIAPSQSKVYLVKNGSNAAVVLKGSATTGVTLLAGVEAICFWNGSDFEIVGLIGPASSTDNAVARFDLTTGKIIQNSGVTIDDSNNVSGVAQLDLTTLNATTIDATNLEVTNVKAKDGTASITIADSTGVVTVSTQLNVDNIRIDGNTISSTNTNGNIAITPNGTGEVDITKVDIDGGTIDATTIGGTTRAAGSFTTLDANGNVTLGDATSDTITATGRFNTDLVPSTDNARDLGTTALKWKQAYATNFTENGFPVVSQTDIGSAPNQIPLNQYLGNLAYQNADAIAGPVVIGVQSSSDALRITQTGSGNCLVVEDSANPDATPFVVDASGNVISGYTSVVQIAGITPHIQSLGTSTSGSSIGAVAFANDATTVPNIYIGKSRGALGTVGTITQSGDAIGGVQFVADDGNGLIRAAQITSAVDGTPGTNDMPGRLLFSTTADGASTPTERMRIDSAGNINLGSGGVLAGRSVVITKNITGGTSGYALFNFGTVQSDVTTEAVYFRTAASTVNSSFTVGNIKHYEALQATFGASSTVTNQFGFIAGNNLTGATNNFGFYSNIASGSGRWNFYANGTAANYMAGTLQTGSTIGVGGATPAASGAGISFPATQSASSDANTLDDYEEGTWTPTGNGVTLTVTNATYTKIGRVVNLSFDITWPNTANGNNADIQNLPFTVATSGAGGVSIGYNTGTTGIWWTSGGSTEIASFSVTNANMSTDRMIASVTYFV